MAKYTPLQIGKIYHLFIEWISLFLREFAAEFVQPITFRQDFPSFLQRPRKIFALFLVKIFHKSRISSFLHDELAESVLPPPRGLPAFDCGKKVFGARQDFMMQRKPPECRQTTTGKKNSRRGHKTHGAASVSAQIGASGPPHMQR